MNPVRRFFQRHLRATLFCVGVFLLLNALLINAIARFTSRADMSPQQGISRLADMIVERDGEITASAAAIDALSDLGAWAMLLDGGGNILWQNRLPISLNHSYTAVDVAKFSRWYLDGYPVYTWEHPRGLLVIGYPRGSVAKYSYSVGPGYYPRLAAGVALAFMANLLLMLFLLIRNNQRVERALRPILSGIGAMARGERVSLREQGELKVINAELNRASAFLQKKDRARADWISGISHDIRTPLSLILGYAGTLEEVAALPEDIRAQANMIRRQAEKLRRLVSNLNLASRLEYAMQPVSKAPVNPVELVRQSLSAFVNGGLDPRFPYELTAGSDAEAARVNVDASLLLRLLDNAIGNSIVHNPEGCAIHVRVALLGPNCLISIGDTGRGVDPGLLARINARASSALSQDPAGEIAHGNGLRLIRRIAEVNGGTVCFENALPHGFCVKILLPLWNGDSEQFY